MEEGLTLLNLPYWKLILVYHFVDFPYVAGSHGDNDIER
jgi:hypothetical protein